MQSKSNPGSSPDTAPQSIYLLPGEGSAVEVDEALATYNLQLTPAENVYSLLQLPEGGIHFVVVNVRTVETVARLLPELFPNTAVTALFHAPGLVYTPQWGAQAAKLPRTSWEELQQTLLTPQEVDPS